MFVRTKKIKGKEYGYIVENKWKDQGSRQRVVGYIGRILKTEKGAETIAPVLTDSFQTSIKALLKWELNQHGFIEENGTMKQESIVVDIEKQEVKNGQRDTGISMNEGILCAHTLKELLNFIPGENPNANAERLAMLLLGAGIKAGPEKFIELHEKFGKQKQDEVKEFYY